MNYRLRAKQSDENNEFVSTGKRYQDAFMIFTRACKRRANSASPTFHAARKSNLASRVRSKSTGAFMTLNVESGDFIDIGNSRAPKSLGAIIRTRARQRCNVINVQTCKRVYDLATNWPFHGYSKIQNRKVIWNIEIFVIVGRLDEILNTLSIYEVFTIVVNNFLDQSRCGWCDSRWMKRLA